MRRSDRQVSGSADHRKILESEWLKVLQGVTAELRRYGKGAVSSGS